jgi:hypothetical protein
MKTSSFLIVSTICLTLLAGGCTSDPPVKGKELYIYNQCNHPVIALLTIDDISILKFDTFLVNNQPFIRRRAGYIPEYGTFEDFMSNELLEDASRNKRFIKYFIIDEKDAANTAQQIMDSTLYRFIEIDPDSILKNSFNSIFVHPDSTYVQHAFNPDIIKK